jgi:hypothetical protein
MEKASPPDSAMSVVVEVRIEEGRLVDFALVSA